MATSQMLATLKYGSTDSSVMICVLTQPLRSAGGQDQQVGVDEDPHG
ncbi:MAG TPA: hypothetical protein VIT42_02755 [Microlunatus sp.]